MGKKLLNVYHATKAGNGDKIIRDGWNVSREINNGQVYGRGIYFWELESDAHTFGKIWYGENGYDIVEETIPLIDGQFTHYDHNKRAGNHDTVAQGLLNRGICCMIISRSYMDRSTIEAKGNAYVWLVDINEDHVVINY